MGKVKRYAMVAGMLAVSATSFSARAADLLPPPLLPEPVEQPFDFAGGWYLRGDVGVSAYRVGRVSSPDVTPYGGFYQNDLASGAFAGGGVGYQFTSWFRADVTGEYRFSTGAKFLDKGNYINGAGNQAVSYETSDGNYSGGLVLLNGYFDLGTWWGVTPFIGGGVGYAHNRFSGFTNTSQNIDLVSGFASPGGGTFRNYSKDSFAWALHAGLGYDVSPHLKLELAYRYANLGEARTGVIDCFCGLVLQPVKVREIESHDIKIGMRWLLGGEEMVPESPPPLIRKY